MHKPTIYEALKTKLGREPSHNELIADVNRILGRVSESERIHAENLARVCPECDRTPTWTDPENTNHIVCSRCDLECLLIPLSESERIHAENLARVTSKEYRRIEKSVCLIEKTIRRAVK